uniref:Sterile alpha motif domain containing 14 n=1 Tax=Fundulus heteroclitus TaxID=8078 RepID=A0A3Q2Q300_FUNHE
MQKSVNINKTHRLCSVLPDREPVPDLLLPVPETELLDNSIQKGRAQLSVKARRHRPSRSRYRDSVSSTEGDDGFDRKDSPVQSTRSPLHLAMRGSSPSPDLLVSSRSPDEGASLVTPSRRRYHQLTNATSQEALVTPSSSPSKSSPSSDCSPVYMRRNRRPDSEVLVSDTSRDTSPADHGSPTVVFDKKTKRRFLDLGPSPTRPPVCSIVRCWTRLCPHVVLREPSESPSRSSGSFVSFSWFTEGRGSFSSSGTPPCSPKIPPLEKMFDHTPFLLLLIQESALSEEFSPPQTSSSTSPPAESSSRSSHPYHTLSQSSDEPCDEPSSCVSSWTTQEVCQWLQGLHMDQYIPEFSARNIDGEQLLQMDGAKLKGLGVLSSSDRSALKRRIKDVQTAVGKERKALDKLEKQKEKQRRKDQEQRRN